ncbi:MAG: flagellar biosynthetic protein FliQ [Deltaproteobacteria bacterium CG11_big_fil_rev_8_21_14_0_20_45_16]|nr:MAG: flagellar biosynthetic protein FliQ [Deltaproteobacteria bacterium CG11_big_fil_rev_8_21_14_0_20_45_16]
MTSQFIESVAVEAMRTILIVSSPVLGVALVIGLAMSIFQATTQINEMTLAYIPKIVAVYVTLVVAGGFIMTRLMSFTSGIFSDFSRYVQ